MPFKGTASEEAVARVICRAYCQLHKRPAWGVLTFAEQNAEVDHQWDLWITEARAVCGAFEVNIGTRDGFGGVGVRYLGTGDGEFERGKDVGRAIGWDAAKRDTSKSLGTDQ